MLSVAAVAATAITITAVVPAQAQDGHAQSQVVTAVPASFTPNINDGSTFAINQIGSRILVGGSFSNESNHGSSTVFSQPYVFAFDATTGALDTNFVPRLNGAVESIEPGPSADTAYIAGTFSTVNGVADKSIILVNTTNGAIVAPFKAPTLNGIGNAIRLTGGRLLLAGGFTTANGVAHGGLVSLNPTTGALDPFMNIQLTGHHNYNGSGADGGVGGNEMDVSPNGRQLVVIGNFKNANGVQHDQIVMIDLTGSSAVINPNWNTLQYTAACASGAYDSYVRDINWAPDGSYFVVVATGASGTNSDGTRSLCDSAARWSAFDTGTNVKPTWVDYTGNDTLSSVAVTGTAIYVGGHERWLNNPNASDSAGAGSVPRPGMAALDPANGLPLTWNPGRNPRGAGAYAMFASANGVYVGMDTSYFGSYKYLRARLGYFPLAGGYTPASTSTASLPGNVYEAGPTNSSTAGPNDLAYRNYSPPNIGAQTTVANTGVTWSNTRGAFVLGSTIFYGQTDGTFREASFNGTTVGASSSIDPYDDPAWDNVQTGSGQTYQGVKSGYYGEINNVTGAFYSDGRLYYSLSGRTSLYWRYFTPDSGIIGGTEFTASGGNFLQVSGMFLSGSTLYYARSIDGTLHSVSFSNGGTNGTNPSVSGTDTVVSGPLIDGRDWRSRSMFLYAPPAANQPPTARATASCTSLTCSFDGSTSSDPDGSVSSYAWTFGDGQVGSGATPSHTYAGPGTYNYTLTVTDNGGASSPAFHGSVTVTSTSAPIAFVGSAGAVINSGTSVTVTTPSAVAVGDTELLYVTTTNAATGVITTPSGWSPVTTQNSLPVQTAVFRKTATASDPNSAVTDTLTSSGPSAAQLVSYRGVGTGTVTTAGAADAATATHVAPAIAVTTTGSWVVSFWADKSSSTTTWTLPSGVPARNITVGSGGGHVSGALGDSNGPQTSGSYPAQSASVGATASGKAAMISLVLPPQ